MRYFDLHCDTLSRCVDSGCGVYQNGLSLDAKRLSEFETAVQVFAAYINSRYSGRAAYERFESQYEVFKNAEFGDVTPILSIENMSAAAGNTDNIYHFAECGVRIASLTWNGENELAGGIGSERGLTDFGRESVRVMERLGIVVDVSHLNDRSFYDLCDVAEKPFIATHSNARAVCGEPRNLTDDQLKIIFDGGGVVGINLYPQFIGKRRRKYDDLLRHIEHMCALGGEEHIALGTDFDGADMDERFCGVEKMPDFYECIVKSYSKSFADKMFFENCNNFFKIF